MPRRRMWCSRRDRFIWWVICGSGGMSEQEARKQGGTEAGKKVRPWMRATIAHAEQTRNSSADGRLCAARGDRFPLLANAFWMAAVRDSAAGTGSFDGGLSGRRENGCAHLQYRAHPHRTTSADWIFVGDCAHIGAALWIDLDGAYWDGSHAWFWTEVPDRF